MTSFRRASIVFLAVVAFAAVLASANAKNVKFMVGNSNGNDIVLLDTKNHKLTTLVPTSAGLDFPDTMLAIPGKDRFLVATGDELADSKILIINAKNGRVIGRFDDGNGPMYRPYGLAWGPNGDLYVSSFKGNQVLRYSKSGRYLGTVGTSNELLMGPNALLFGKDGLLYCTTEGSIMINGSLNWIYPSQIVRLKRNNQWEIFSDDAGRYTTPNSIFGPNYLGLANSPVNDNLIFVSDFSNGILAFDLSSKQMKGRIETSFTGIPANNGMGALAFNPKPKHSRYEVFAPGFLPTQNNNGAVLRFRFDQVSRMSQARLAFEVSPTSRLNKPIAIAVQP